MIEFPRPQHLMGVPAAVLIHNEEVGGGGDPAGLLIQVQVKGLAIILQLKGDHPFCLEINEEPAAIITMHLMMLLLPWHAMGKWII